MKPLSGLELRIEGSGGALGVAVDLLSRLGVEGQNRHGPAGGLDGGPEPDTGLPAGTMEAAAGILLATAAIEAVLDGDDVAVSRRAAADHVRRPLLTDGPDAVRPNPPVPIGAGAVNCDLGPDGDEEAFARLVAAIGPDAGDPELVSARAQEWRLAVTPYRTVVDSTPSPVCFSRTAGSPSAGRRPHSAHPSCGIRVVDMSAMWAGPLATGLLAARGQVTKIEPECRLDGLRTGAPGLAGTLNYAKRVAPLDLRSPGDRVAFEDLVAGADLVVDSFSRRVMPNLGLTSVELRRIRPDLMTMSVPAFGRLTPEQDWIAYGSGVHALSGLGYGPEGPWAPDVSYPDPLAGLTAHAVALAMWLGRSRGWQPRHAEVSLHGALRPLVDVQRCQATR